MNKEKEIINRILDKLPRSADQLNQFFESDAEIIKYGSGHLLFTVDEFSSEDLFRDNDPYVLGWNLATGTLSDILASGGDPLYYAHSLSVDQNKWNESYLDSFAGAIADVMKLAGAKFIGGDTGTSEKWHYTGIAFGSAQNPLMRVGATPGDIFYSTGKIGAGNLEAGLKYYSDKSSMLDKLAKSYKTVLNFRMGESKLLREYASCCIDTSDGFLNALITISEINHSGFVINNLPFLSEGLIACKLLSKSKLCLFAGECGEYELLFTIRKQDELSFLAAAKEKKYSFHRLGEVTEDETRWVILNRKKLDFGDFNVSARDYNNLSDYLDKLENYLSWKIKTGL